MGVIIPGMRTSPDLASLSLPVIFPGSDWTGKRRAQIPRPSSISLFPETCYWRWQGFFPKSGEKRAPQAPAPEWGPLETQPTQSWNSLAEEGSSLLFNTGLGSVLYLCVILEFSQFCNVSLSLLCTPFYAWENWNSEISSDVPKNTQLVHGRNRIQTKVCPPLKSLLYWLRPLYNRASRKHSLLSLGIS